MKVVLFSLLLIPGCVHSNQAYSKYSQNTYGGIGLIETPTARFSEDGEFGFGFSAEKPYNRLYSKVQIFPWMEAVLRYTEGEFWPYFPGSEQTWKDKGIDFKFRIFEESESFPEVALGLLDIGGTGAYSAEYLAASKAINNFDVNVGIGWGRLGGVDHFSNPIGWIDDNRKTRGGYFSRGGKLSFGRLFSGENVSVFGGIEYFTSIPDLSLKIEYDTSNYELVIGKEKRFDELGDVFELNSRINYALNYRLHLGERDRVDLSLGYIRGDTIYARASVNSNLNFSGAPKIIMGAEDLRVQKFRPYHEQKDKWKEYIVDKIIWEMGNSGFTTHNVIFSEDEIAAEVSQEIFSKTTQAFDLASRILANNAPRNIKKVTVINIDQGIETIRSTVDIDMLRKYVSKGAFPEELLQFDQRNDFQSENSYILENKDLYPNFHWEVKPHALGTLQHQQKFYFWQLEALIHGMYSIKKGLYVSGDIGIDLANNYDEYNYHIPDGALHHVRQDRRRYLTEGKTGIRRLALDYLFAINPNVNGRFTAGYLEWMYGGLGGELLYMPDNKRWAIGVDAYYLKQREFDQRFSFREYQTFTGFITYYQDIPFYDMRLKISAGRFLGKDVGAHIDVSRRFETGARVGAIVALTDCDPQCVGEGSFNKWLYFELPMELFYVQRGTRAKAGYAWSPLTKDAGTKVEVGNLYKLMRSANDEVDEIRLKSWSFGKIFNGFSTKPSTIKN